MIRLRYRSLKWYEYMIMLIAFLSVQINVGQFVAFGSFLLFILITLIRSFIKRGGQLIFRFNNILIFILWVLIVLSLVRPNNENNMEFIIQLFWLSIGTLLLCSILFIEGLNSKQMLDIMVYTSTFMGVVIIISYFLKYPIKHIIEPPYAGTRIVGGFDGPNELAAYNLFPFTYSLNMILFTKESKKMKYVLNTIITSIIIILTWSRGGIVGWIFSLVISFLVFFKNKITLRRNLTLIFIAIILLLIFNSYIMPTFFEVRKNASSRLDMIKLVFEPIIQKPIFGWGLGDISKNSSIKNSTPHNGYIFIMYAGGIISLLLYLTFLLIITWKIIIKKDFIKFMLYITFLIQEMVFNNLIRGRVSFVFWLLLILIFCGSNLSIARNRINLEIKHDNLKT